MCQYTPYTDQLTSYRRTLCFKLEIENPTLITHPFILFVAL